MCLMERRDQGRPSICLYRSRTTSAVMSRTSGLVGGCARALEITLRHLGRSSSGRTTPQCDADDAKWNEQETWLHAGDIARYRRVRTHTILRRRFGSEATVKTSESKADARARTIRSPGRILREQPSRLARCAPKPRRAPRVVGRQSCRVRPARAVVGGDDVEEYPVAEVRPATSSSRCRESAMLE